MKKHLIVGEEDIGQRLDKFLSNRLDFLSRTKINNIIKDGLVLIDKQKRKASFIVCQGQQFQSF